MRITVVKDEDYDDKFVTTVDDFAHWIFTETIGGKNKLVAHRALRLPSGNYVAHATGTIIPLHGQDSPSLFLLNIPGSPICLWLPCSTRVFNTYTYSVGQARLMEIVNEFNSIHASSLTEF